ncbi:MAG: FAD-dependent oxidoreductase [Eubacteriales bacterium]|nr:FAD-dependent oxidoreductase [Eubacteriales bacterium]
MSTKIVIIGSGIAGISAAEAARQQNLRAEIVLISEENDLPYYRLRLCEAIADPKALDALTIETQAHYDALNISVKLGQTVKAIDRLGKKISLTDGHEEAYDRLVLATGSSSFVPPLEGVQRPGVKTLWTLENVRQLTAELKPGHQVVVIGGGLLGLLAADHIQQRGAEATVLELSSRLLANQLDAVGSAIFQASAEKRGIHFALGAETAEIVGQYDEPHAPVAGVRLKDGRLIEADLVLLSIGVRANSQLAAAAGLPITRRIVTDLQMRTIDPDIFAAGDAAEPDEYWFGLWPVAMDQGRVAGTNAAGGDAIFAKNIPPYFIQTLGTEVAVQGDKGGPGEFEADIDVEQDPMRGTYRKLVYRGGVLCGFMLVGDTSEMLTLQKKIGKRRGESV